MLISAAASAIAMALFSTAAHWSSFFGGVCETLKMASEFGSRMLRMTCLRVPTGLAWKAGGAAALGAGAWATAAPARKSDTKIRIPASICPKSIIGHKMTTRRNFLALAAGGLLAAQDPARPKLLVRSVRPEDLEMQLSGFADYLTPNDQFFVRTHVYVPSVSLNEWRLKVEGEVASPLTLTLDNLKQLPSVGLVSVLECAGNGRGFYEPSVAGMQWTNGAVGNARWRGVRLAEVLKKAGVKDSAKEILFDGADVPLGTMPDFQRSIPVKKALDSNTLLAYEMNGEMLPAKHGFPLRVVVPGWASDSWVKWLTSIRVLDKEHDGFWMKGSYRHPGKPVAPGTAVPPEQMQPVASLRVKSVIASPLDGATVMPAKAAAIRGVAWSGDGGAVTAVEVSVDGG